MNRLARIKLRPAVLATLLITPGLAPHSHAIELRPIPARPASPAAPTPLPELAPVSPAPTPGNGVFTPLPTPTTAPVPKPAPAPSAPPATLRPPSDPLYARQWNLQTIRAPQAWALRPMTASATAAPAGTAPVTVAVLDTGYVNSPELSGRVVNGHDFVADPARSGDGDGRDADSSGVGEFAYHAEVVANLIAAAHDGRGMAGINPQARIVQVRVAGTDGTIAVPDLVDALKWAAGLPVPGVPANPNPAKVLNLSLYADFIPLTGCDPRVQAAVDAVTARGALVIAGAANDGADAGGYSPAGCRGVLTVTSVTEAGGRPGYANWGRSVALAAPGGVAGRGIVASSLSGAGGERSPDGTSFAAPHATGVASLLLSARPRLSPGLLRAYLTRSATPFPGGACDPQPTRTCGSGTLNAEAALKLALASSLGK